MAKHFKEPEVQSTAVMSRAKSESTEPQQRLRTEGTETFMPYGQVASYRASHSEAATTGEYFMGDVPARGGARAVGRGILLTLAWLFRLCAFAMVLLVLLNAVNFSFIRHEITTVADTITSYLPWAQFGVLGVDTPFGGVFRGDFALIALALFVVDWLLCRARAGLR